MKKKTNEKQPGWFLSRRDFVKMGGAALFAGAASPKNVPALRRGQKARPNILLIITDQQHIDTIAAGGCPHVRTPALDSLKEQGLSFTQSYSSNPLCSPARSSIFTGRTSSEAAVHANNLGIRPDIPNLGQWLSQEADYEALYAGKWHLPRTFTYDIPGFKVLNTGIGGLGYLCDTMTSRACESYLRNRSRPKPFFMVASFLQPHDICEWLRLNTTDPGQLRYKELAPQLPELPDNFQYDKNEPEAVKRTRQAGDPFKTGWSKQQWRYYRWSYYRHVEFVDAEIGRILQALQDCGYAADTLIVFTADHGEGMAHHQMVRKNILYDESVKVPLIFSWSGHVRENQAETFHVASGLDIMPTLCDFAGIKPPGNMRGRSLRPILEGPVLSWGNTIVSEVAANTGRMVRTPRYKYIAYKNNSVEQLFDMNDDPGETKNLATGSQYASTLAHHREILRDWESRLDVPEKVPNTDAWWYKQ